MVIPSRWIGISTLAMVLVACGAAPPDPPASSSIGVQGEVGALRVDRAVSWGLPSAGSLTVGFRVRNEGTETDTLQGVSAVAGRSMLHDLQGGRMVRLEAVPLPPGREVVMGLGGPHVMLDSLFRDTWDSSTVDVVLRFSRAGALPLRVPIVTFTEGIRELRQ